MYPFALETRVSQRRRDTRLPRSVSEEVQNRRHKSSVVLKDATVPGIRIYGELRIRQTARHVGRMAAVDHNVVVAVRDENGLRNDREVVGRIQSRIFNGF